MDMVAPEASKLRIVIFGGSFNPVHNGHVAICRYVAGHDLADRMLVVPCYEHPFGKRLVAFEHRLAMCELALAPLPRVALSPIERDLGGVSYTARTIRTLQARCPDARYALLLGSDLDLSQWREAEWLRAHIDVLPIPRGPRSPIPDVSASAIRERIAHGDSILDSVPEAIAKYIVAERLY